LLGGGEDVVPRGWSGRTQIGKNQESQACSKSRRSGEGPAIGKEKDFSKNKKVVRQKTQTEGAFEKKSFIRDRSAVD